MTTLNLYVQTSAIEELEISQFPHQTDSLNPNYKIKLTKWALYRPKPPSS